MISDEENEKINIVLPRTDVVKKKRVMSEKQLLALKKGREKSHARGLLRNKNIETVPNVVTPDVIAPQKTKKELRQE